MKSLCKNLILAIQGMVVMSQELDSMYQSFMNNKVPASWNNVAFPSLRPLASWMKDLIARVEFMSNWLTGGNPTCYWISGLFFP